MPALHETRNTFLEYFRRQGHEVVPSSPIVPLHDPTLLFTNAGMVPFKNLFTGTETRSFKKATSAQKCVRAGGKHNDLDNVGYTARHHTFFEMLGNFSFSDYFKAEAIELAWNLITGEFGLSRDRLLVSVYHEDEEAFLLWKKIAGFPDERIIRIATADNFWSMGDRGPCGPCSEIFYDHGAHIPGGPPGSPDEEGDRFIEIWNLVFMQYDQVSADERRVLPAPSIDTGMGLERMTAVLQGTHDNYETDVMQALIAASAEASCTQARGRHSVSHRVIADHLRASCFLIAEGVLPSNEGRGYVLRRIMRRAMRHAHLLGVREPLLHRLVSVLVQQMGVAYGELERAKALITATLKQEETRFREMLARGLRLLDEEIARIPVRGRLDGNIAFRLYDTYGFPLDLTQDVLRSNSMTVDVEGFEAAMKRQREEARTAWTGSGGAATDPVWFALREQTGATLFLGYETQETEGIVMAILEEDPQVGTLNRVETLDAGADGILVFDQTPFYGESGGQAGDTGWIGTSDAGTGNAVTNDAGTADAKVRFEVTDTQKMPGELHAHAGHLANGQVRVGDRLHLCVDVGKRTATRANHSATHLLHEALRRVLGPHVMQKGSLVDDKRLRFDFAHHQPVSDAEMAAIEKSVNEQIRHNGAVSTRLMTPDAAMEAGALALFGEKYGDEVRVLSMGAVEGGRPYSVELCGGTHVARAGDIGLFRIVSEGAVASGVRRIEALTAECARLHLGAREDLLRDAAQVLRTRPEELPSRITALLEERARLERELGDARNRLALGSAEEKTAIEYVGPVKVMVRKLDGVKPKDLRGFVDDAKKQLGSGVAAFVTVTQEGKAGLVVGVTPDLAEQYSAVDLVRAGAEALGGQGGGGRADMAQAGGPDGKNAETALHAVKNALGALAGVG